METGPGAERHSDDELASALEREVARITSAIPVVGTAAVPGAEPEPESEPEPDAEEDGDWIGPPTQAISFEDLPVRRQMEGPQPTFSAWVGAAARPVPSPQPERPAPAPPSRAEPLSFVPPELALRDSQPLPLLAEGPEPEPETEHEPEPEPAAGPAPPVVPRIALAPALPDLPGTGPVVTHELGPIDATSARIDTDLHDDADDVHSTAPSPVASPRVALDETVLSGAEPVPAPLFEPEEADLEPSAVDRRVGRAARMFWLWFAGTSSLISIGVGATLFTLGLSLRQLLVATLVGVALSFLPLGLGTLAGKWSGQPTMVVSRATFGLRGNAIPAILALLTKLFWGAVLLWLAGTAAGSLAVSWGGAADRATPTAVALLAAILIAGLVAYFGYALVARVQLLLTIASAALISVMIAGTWRHVDLVRALAVPDALWTHVVTGAVLVFSYLGLAWAMSSAEVARYQRPTSSGGAAMLWATFGAGVPPFVLVSYGGLLAASHPGLADRLASDPVSGFVALGLPGWFPVPLLLAVGLSLISALVLTMYSAGFTLDALGVRLGRRWSTVVAGGPIALAGIVLALTVTDLDSVIRGVPTALSVPVAAWTGLFAAETMLRERRFHQPSLLATGGVYPDWRWVNLGMLFVASAVGLGLVSSDLPWLAWEGYLFRLLGIDPEAGIGTSNIGVVVALVLGLVTPLVAGIPAVRRQERGVA
ncbi:hypothetical protein LLS1_18000 [Leifsonia sp. LS1]|uniref:purine-cytosine permease family protein n=1 Tax=Leifsonia sp. LS1 TaxID=2828483 RepID=UPI001CFD07C0|nr:cytosine permease [Leifsonia sp. LS1]GIT80131.1 hypothetical protein LLS1_18000 [Leifsonia sp. LS1]